MCSATVDRIVELHPREDPTMSLTRREALAAGAALLGSTALSIPSAFARQFPPHSPRQRAQVGRGRWLSYSEYGDPDGPLVFYFHGIPGSRLEVRLIEQDALQAGIRLVAVDRPGLGYSTYYGGRKVVDWPADIVELAAILGYADAPFGALSMSGGSPYGTACAYQIPDRLTHLALVSGHTRLGAPGTSPGSEDKMIELVVRRPRLAKAGFNFVSRRLSRRPGPVIQKITKNWTADDRRLILCNPITYNQLIANLRESVRCGTQGLITDIQLLACPWGFPLNNISDVPVSIWHGKCDRIAPISMGHYFQRHIAGSELTIDPSAGHVTTLKRHAAEILSRFHQLAA